jgi:F420-dependent oxidoreductase-like protein
MGWCHVKLAVMIEGQEDLTWERWRHLAEQAERLGYDALFRSDHLTSLAGVGDRETIEAWVSFAYLATATRRIRFGPLVSPITFRPPYLMGLQAAAIDVLSGGRLEMGLGAGWHQPEHDRFGLPFPPVAERFERLEEAIQLILALWTERPSTFHGRFYSLAGAHGSPQPAQRPYPPILLGGTGEKRLLRLVAKYADEWNAYGLVPEAYRAKIAVLEQRCREVGRDPGQIRRSLMLTFLVGESDAQIREHLQALRERHPDAAPAEALSDPRSLRQHGWLVGRPEELIEQVRAYEALGAYRIMLQHLAMTYDPALELIAREVLPAVS